MGNAEYMGVAREVNREASDKQEKMKCFTILLGVLLLSLTFVDVKAQEDVDMWTWLVDGSDAGTENRSPSCDRSTVRMSVFLWEVVGGGGIECGVEVGWY